jgi:DHA1 family bicyclomycin/chloramphenicol resistance-like MFS transporter
VNGQAGRRHGLRTIAILASVAALGSMAIHMLVPALPVLAGELGLNPARAQQVVSVYLGGLACGQLIAGPVADRWGRRPVLLLGLACYMLGAAGGALAANFPLLLGARLLQAMGGAAGVVASRVMVGDLFDRAEAASRQATLMTIVLLSPAISPVIGGSL